MPGFHRDPVHYSSHFVLSLHGLPHQLPVVVCVCRMCGGHRSSRRVAVYATGVERHSYAKHSTRLVLFPSFLLILQYDAVIHWKRDELLVRVQYFGGTMKSIWNFVI